MGIILLRIHDQGHLELHNLQVVLAKVIEAHQREKQDDTLVLGDRIRQFPVPSR